MKTLVPLLLLVLIHHFLLTPLIRKKLPLYLGFLVILLVLYGVWCLGPGSRMDVPPPPDFQSGMVPPPPPPPKGEWKPSEARGGHRPLRPEAMKLIMGVLVIGADLGVFFYTESRRRERRMKEMEAEFDKQRREMKAALSAQETDPVLHFKADYRTVNVDVSKIVYVESMSEYIRIFLSDSETPVVVLYSLKRLMEQLPANRFMRIHRSYIIALNHIAEASKSSVLLDNGKSFPIGEHFRPAFADYLSSC